MREEIRRYRGALSFFVHSAWCRIEEIARMRGGASNMQGSSAHHPVRAPYSRPFRSSARGHRSSTNAPFRAATASVVQLQGKTYRRSYNKLVLIDHEIQVDGK